MWLGKGESRAAAAPRRFQTAPSDWCILRLIVQVRAGLTLALVLAAQAFCAAPKIIAVDVNGMVHPITTEIVDGALAQAKREKASLVLVRLNTPGGLMEAMRATIEKIVASPVPVVTYVAPSGGRAASAGCFLL